MKARLAHMNNKYLMGHGKDLERIVSSILYDLINHKIQDPILCILRIIKFSAVFDAWALSICLHSYSIKYIKSLTYIVIFSYLFYIAVLLYY